MALGSAPFKPFVEPFGPASILPPSDLATIAGVDVETIEDFRTGIPSWRLQRDYRKVAKAVGMPGEVLRAKLAAARRLVFGRASRIENGRPERSIDWNNIILS